MGKLEVIRSKGYADALRSYQVTLDEKVIGEIRKGATESFDIAPGSHSISVKIDWASSETLSFSIQNGETVFLECGNNTTFFTTLFRTFIKPETYLWIKRIN